jgi:hypothetical protein
MRRRSERPIRCAYLSGANYDAGCRTRRLLWFDPNAWCDFDLSGNPVDLGEYYACGYGLADKGLLPRNRTMVVSAELDTRVLRGRENGRWSVGSDALPPPGQQRTIIINRRAQCRNNA